MQQFMLKQFYNLYYSLRGCRQFPLYINLELTNDCNLSCLMCPRDKMKRDVGHMQKDTFLKTKKGLFGYTFLENLSYILI